MFCAMKLFDTIDGQQVRTYSADVGTHAVEHVAQLLDIGFARSIINRGGTFGKNGSHDDIGSTRHRGLVEQHIGTLQLLG